MKLKYASIKNFRRLENVTIDFEEQETVFVGPNNSRKTSSTAAFSSFLSSREFQIHDFSVSKMIEIDAFDFENNNELPIIEFDLWFSINPDSIAFGRAFSLLPNISENFDEVGIRCEYKVKDAEAFWNEYIIAFSIQIDGTRRKSVSHFLSLENNLTKYFSIFYASLEKNGDELISSPLDTAEGKKLLKSLIKVDFVDAQRNIDDEEKGRSNKLSYAFASFYQKNLDQAETTEEAILVIDENNDRLTEHYGKHFGGLMAVIKSLGVPSVNDREIRIVSSVSSEDALKGSTDLLYVDVGSSHELPEAYNGLGFKNLVLMAVEISHFHLQWMRTEENRPLCQIIFIEEPEVHLHAQVQQTFISNMWNILNNAADGSELVPQLAITTHSSHVLDTVEFSKVRYFQRCELIGEDADLVQTLNASRVHSLRSFQPEAIEINGEIIDESKALDFLRKYLKLTHCDLFFSDAIILIEGTVEKLLLNRMIDKCAPTLRSKYLTILEVGGAYSHRFAGLLQFLHIPYLVITDIDSVDPANNRKACRADLDGSVTSNASLKSFFDLNTIKEFIESDPALRSQEPYDRFVSFQMPLTINRGDKSLIVHGRTLEEAFVYENLSLFWSEDLKIGIDLPVDLEEVFEAVYEHIKSSSYKKTEFALDTLASSVDWKVPVYISDGLVWLEQRLSIQAATPVQD